MPGAWWMLNAWPVCLGLFLRPLLVFTTEGRSELEIIWEVMVAKTQTDVKLESCPSLPGRIIQSHPPGRQINQAGYLNNLKIGTQGFVLSFLLQKN